MLRRDYVPDLTDVVMRLVLFQLLILIQHQGAARKDEQGELERTPFLAQALVELDHPGRVICLPQPRNHVTTCGSADRKVLPDIRPGLLRVPHIQQL